MIYNYSKLYGRIKEKCGTQENFSKLLGLSRTTLNQKLKNKVEFSQSEIRKSIIILELDSIDIPEYFFCTNSLEN